MGIFTAQGTGLRGGAVLDLNNSVVTVQPPQVPYLQMLLIVGINILVFLVLTYVIANRNRVSQILVNTGYVLSNVALVSYGLIVVQACDSLKSIAVEVPEGFDGWLLKASNDSSIHLLTAIALATVFYKLFSRTRTSQKTESHLAILDKN